MKMFGFSVHDKAVGAFLPLFFARSVGEAIRTFTQAATNGEHQFNKFKGDYDLYKVGEWDDLTGIFTSSGPDRVIGGLEVTDPA